MLARRVSGLMLSTLRLRDTHARARAAYVNTHGDMNQFFLAKNKNEDSDLGWTADLEINLDEL